MSTRQYLPSAQFIFIAASLVLSAGLVYAAERFTAAPQPARILSVADDVSNIAEQSKNSDWQTALYTIQAQQNGADSSAGAAAQNPDSTAQMAPPPSITDTVGRTLLAGITGSVGQDGTLDALTQNQVIASALGQMSQKTPLEAHTQGELRMVGDSTTTLHAYGNALALSVAKNNKSNVRDTMIIVDLAVSQDDQKQLDKLPAIHTEYLSFVDDLLKIPVPQTLAPFHLAILNNLSQTADTYSDMQALLTDPLRGLAALRLYQSSSNETVGVFINIARELHKDGILFNTDEPGALWDKLLSAQQ